MRSAVLAGVLLLAFATTANAQWRGALSSRPAAPATTSRPPAPLPIFLPVWPQWGVVLLPETTTVSPPHIVEGGPTGGVQLDVLPWRAQVFVDGVLAGLVEEFRGYYQHLELPAGAHRIAIVATGYEPHVIDVVVVPGKTLTYRATLR